MFKAKPELTTIIRRVKTICHNEEPLTVGDKDYTNVDAVSYLIGLSIGTHVEMPTSRHPLPKAWLSTNYGTDIRQFIGSINEGALIDVNLAYEAACEMFEVRYNLLYPDNISLDALFKTVYEVKRDLGGDSSRTDLLLSVQCNDSLSALFNQINLEIEDKKADSGAT